MKVVRCAIYTRKSSDEGLEQDFNSLDAQREACAAYILSQAGEGWQLLPDRYDDGGISGGTLERPALQRMMDDVRAGKIDIIVIYKIDRLTRSLLDFAKLVEAFDKVGTSFVSVTQAFNTTNSMGRLTLNMLLSFAQFEREVTAERIRDKLAASKAKGMWMGGVPPLGYKPNGRSLSIVEDHAAIVRDIFARYHKFKNVREVAAQLKAEGLRTPVRKTATGRKYGGAEFSRGAIYQILKNPVYAGKIGHRGTISDGNHEAIIAFEDWGLVQTQLASNLNGGRGGKKPTLSSLAGKLFDGAGEPMIASHTQKAKKRYRYYVSKSLHLGEPERSDLSRRVAAQEIETVAALELASLFDDPLVLAERAGFHVEPAKFMSMVQQCGELAERLRGEHGLRGLSHLIERAELHETRLDIVVSASALVQQFGMVAKPVALPPLILSQTLALARTGSAVRLVLGNGAIATGISANAGLIELIERGRRWWKALRTGKIGITELSQKEGYTASYVTRITRLAFLAPAVIDAILMGKQKAGVNSALLLRHDAIPDDWAEQMKLFVAA